MVAFYTVSHTRVQHLYVPLGVWDDIVAARAAGVAATNLPQVNAAQ